MAETSNFTKGDLYCLLYDNASKILNDFQRKFLSLIYEVSF